jgi:hypothetical protein
VDERGANFVLYRGELPRGGDAAIVGTRGRQARRVVSALVEPGVLLSKSTRARRCVLHFPPLSPRAGCRDFSRKELDRYSAVPGYRP